MEIVPFGPSHLDDAARLVADRVRTLRARLPLLPPGLEDPASWRPRLEALLADGPDPADGPAPSAVEGPGDRDAVAGPDADPGRDAGQDGGIRPGVVALDRGRPVGFLIAALRPAAGRAYCPDFGNAVVPGGGRVLQALYARAAASWVAVGIHSHIVGSFEGFPDERDAWSWLGFGRLVVDAVRPLAPLESTGVHRTHLPGLTIRPAGQSDVDAVMALEEGLRRHLLASPVWLTLPPPRDRAAHVARLADTSSATLVAEIGGALVADLRIGPHADDVTTLLQDDGTAAITAAFTTPQHRRSGVARSLLDAALDWARQRGYERCGVDFESANLEASRFWPTYFDPVSVALVRRLHPLAGQVVR